MSRSLGAYLPAHLVARLSQTDLPAHLGKVLPLISLDAEGRPHPMLLSYLEVRAVDSGTIGIVVGAGTRSARNLADRRVATLLLVEPEQTVYLKLRVRDGPWAVSDLPDLSLFVLDVEDVLEDRPAAGEAGRLEITGGLRYAPAPSLDQASTRATLRALALVPRRPLS